MRRSRGAAGGPRGKSFPTSKQFWEGTLALGFRERAPPGLDQEWFVFQPYCSPGLRSKVQFSKRPEHPSAAACIDPLCYHQCGRCTPLHTHTQWKIQKQPASRKRFGCTHLGGLRCGCGVHHSRSAAGPECSQLALEDTVTIHRTPTLHSARWLVRLVRGFFYYPRCKQWSMPFLLSAVANHVLQMSHLVHHPPHTHTHACKINVK